MCIKFQWIIYFLDNVQLQKHLTFTTSLKICHKEITFNLLGVSSQLSGQSWEIVNNTELKLKGIFSFYWVSLIYSTKKKNLFFVCLVVFCLVGCLVDWLVWFGLVFVFLSIQHCLSTLSKGRKIVTFFFKTFSACGTRQLLLSAPRLHEMKFSKSFNFKTHQWREQIQVCF